VDLRLLDGCSGGRNLEAPSAGRYIPEFFQMMLKNTISQNQTDEVVKSQAQMLLKAVNSISNCSKSMAMKKVNH
jgi:endonuclease III